MSSRGLAVVSVTGFAVAVVATVFAHVGLGPGHDPTSLTLSDYALFDHGFALVLAMVALSSGTIALLGGMVAEHVPVRGWPTALMLVWALGLVVSAAVPTDPPGMAEMSPAALVHRYASVAAFVALPAAVLLLAARLRRAEVVRWLSLVTLLRRLVAACAVGVAALWYVAYPGQRVLMGLVERGLVALEVLILFTLAMRLLRVTAPALGGAVAGHVGRIGTATPVYKVSRDLPAAHAAYAEPLSCALHAVERAGITFGDVVVVAGCGPIGLGMVAGAAAKSPATVVALDVSDAKLELARLCGADLTLNITETDVVADIRDMTDGNGADVYLEGTGHPSAVPQGLNLLSAPALPAEQSEAPGVSGGHATCCFT